MAAAKAAVLTVDQATALQLGNFAKATANNLAGLRDASVKAAEVCESLEIDSAIATVQDLSKGMYLVWLYSIAKINFWIQNSSDAIRVMVLKFWTHQV